MADVLLLSEPYALLAHLVARAFYEDLEILVFDKLVSLRQALTDKELSAVLHMPEHQVRKGLAQPLKDRLISRTTTKADELDMDTVTAAEFREHQRTLGEVTRYHVDLETIPDFVKFKLHRLLERAGGGAANGDADGADDEAVAWRCTRCAREYTEGDAWMLYSRERNLFLCECGLECESVREPAEGGGGGSSEKQRALEQAVKPLLVALGQTDKEFEEGNHAPGLIRADAAPPGGAAAAAAGATRGGGGAARAGGAAEPSAELEPLHVQIGSSARAAGAGAAGGAAAAKASAVLFWQKDGAAGQKRPRDEGSAGAADGEGGGGAEQREEDAWARALLENQRQQQRQQAHALPPAGAEAGGAAVPRATPAAAPAPPVAPSSAASPRAQPVPPHAEEGEGEEEEEEEEMVAVCGQLVPLSEVTDEDTERMTSEEYKRYYELIS